MLFGNKNKKLRFFFVFRPICTIFAVRINVYKMASLFAETKYQDYTFPEPQYLGAKYIHRGWIVEHIPEDATTILDAFSGSQSIAYSLKQLGKRVVTNDFLKFSSLIGKALIENPRYTLDREDVDLLFSENSDPKEYDLIGKLFAGLFFPAEDAAFADRVRSNVNRLDNPYKQALALTVMCRSMTRKVTMGHFAHTQALAYAADPARVRRNRSLVRPLRELFLDLLPEYNAAVFDNGMKNESYNDNILDLLPRLEGIDVAYFDPPYCNSHADYQSFYHLLETYVEYWKDKRFVNGTKCYEPKRYSGFDKKCDALCSLRKMFELASTIPTWIVSYNDRSYPDINTLTAMILPYRDLRVEKKTYSKGRGGKGSVAGSSEVLLVCTRR